MRTRISFPLLASAVTFLLFVITGVCPALAANIYYVDINCPSAVKDGTSWGTAFTDLQAALATAVSGDTIMVAQGTYKPTSCAGTCTDTDRTISFQLITGVTLQGGYPTGGGTRSPANKTILSGDIGILDEKSDNSYHVVVFNSSSYYDTAVLDGFTITAGNANNWSGDYTNYGGGMYIYGGSPTLTNLTFSDNTAIMNGGGLYASGTGSTLTDVTFTGNSAYSQSIYPPYSPIGQGGAIYLYGGNASLTNVTISGNSAGEGGGGISAVSNARPTLIHVTIFGNTADTSGGLYFNNENDSDAAPVVENSILWGNSPNQIDIGRGHWTISDSVVQDGCPDSNGYLLCTNIITGDPKLGTLGDNGGYTQTIPLLDGSSAIDTGADYGVDTDQRGIARPQGNGYDIGAYEYEKLDVTPPVIKSLIATPNVLWPANGKLVAVVVTVKATDDLSGVASAVLATKDEYHECDGLVAMTPVGGGIFTATRLLPARRNGNDKDGRTYTLTVSVTDGASNVTRASVMVLVPHDQGKK